MNLSFRAIILLTITSHCLCAKSEPYIWKNVVTGGGGGFVSGIIFNEKQKDLIYAKTDIGGAYRWNQTTKHWIPLLDSFGPEDWNLYGVESVATDPVDPNKVYVAAGMYTIEWSPDNGEILRSTDQGNTWKRTKMPFKMGGNMPGRNLGERLAVDPNDNKVIYFGARSGHGLWRSEDYGESFKNVTTFPAIGKYAEKPGDPITGDLIGVLWVVFDPKSASNASHSQTIYVGTADKVGNIFHSKDGGKTWAGVSGQPIGYLPHHGVLSSDGNLYITYSNGAGPNDGSKGEVWKLNTKTGNWTDISPVKSSDKDDVFGYGGLSVDRKSPKTVMVSALNNWWPDTIFFRTTDGGATWTRIWDWTGYPNRKLRYEMDISSVPWLDFGKKNATPPDVNVRLGWWVGSLNIDPHNSDRMMYGTGATIFGSDDLTNWDKNKTIHIKPMADGIEETAVLELISPPKGANLYSVMGDIGGFKHDDLDKPQKEIYSIPYAGTYAHIDYAGLKPEYIVRTGHGDHNAKPPVTSGAYTNDSGLNWFKFNSDPQGIDGDSGSLAVSADASHTLFFSRSGHISYTTDNGKTWNNSAGIAKEGTVSSDRVNPKKFYAYSDGSIFVSTDSGVTFKATVKIASTDSNQLKAVPGHEGEVWFTAGKNGLYHSTNSATTFTKVSGVSQADKIGFGKGKSESYPSIYVSAIIGGLHAIYRSDDKAVTWVHINDNKHQYGPVQCITGDSRIYGRVYFGTNGRGIIYGNPK